MLETPLCMNFSNPTRSDNTAFGLPENCHAAGIETTTAVRPPTQIGSAGYLCDSHAIGACSIGLEMRDRMAMALQTCIDGKLSRDCPVRVVRIRRCVVLAATGLSVLENHDTERIWMQSSLSSQKRGLRQCWCHRLDLPGGSRR